MSVLRARNLRGADPPTGLSDPYVSFSWRGGDGARHRFGAGEATARLGREAARLAARASRTSKHGDGDAPHAHSEPHGDDVLESRAHCMRRWIHRSATRLGTLFPEWCVYFVIVVVSVVAEHEQSCVLGHLRFDRPAFFFEGAVTLWTS